MTGRGDDTATGRHMTSPTSGAPAGPGTVRRETSNLPPRARSASVGGANPGGGRRITSSDSTVSGGNSGSRARTSAQWRSNGGGGSGMSGMDAYRDHRSSVSEELV